MKELKKSEKSPALLKVPSEWQWHIQWDRAGHKHNNTSCQNKAHMDMFLKKTQMGRVH